MHDLQTVLRGALLRGPAAAGRVARAGNVSSKCCGASSAPGGGAGITRQRGLALATVFCLMGLGCREGQLVGPRLDVQASDRRTPEEALGGDGDRGSPQEARAGDRGTPQEARAGDRGSSSGPDAGGSGGPVAVTTTYVNSDEIFPNPERGFAPAHDPPWPAQVTWAFCGEGDNFTAYNWTAWTPALKASDLLAYRNSGTSVVMVRYHLAEFRNGPLSPAFLTQLTADFATSRTAGVKLVLRFVYNWPWGGPDAPVGVVLGHLDQLAPLLRDNVDVIAFMDLGLIGCWGEMHHSSNSLVGPEVNDNTRALVAKVLAVLPKQRMVAFRYPFYVWQYFNGKGSSSLTPIPPVTVNEAFNGSDRARIGHHDDCLVCGEFDWGTWGYTLAMANTARQFLNDDTQFVVQSGEPGDPCSGIVPGLCGQDLDGDGYKDNHDACARVLDIFAKEHWSTINSTYNPGSPAANNRWQSEGCWDTIARRLGYRFRLVQSILPDRVRPGAALAMSITLTNDGWASPYNPRNVEVVLRARSGGGKIYRLAVKSDPRLWLSGQSPFVSIQGGIPASMPAGEYDVLLNLPDPEPTLRGRPEYAIRFANQNTWEAPTGFNTLQRTVLIDPQAKGASYTGTEWFLLD